MNPVYIVPDNAVSPETALLVEAAAVQESLAAGKVRLFKAGGVHVTETTVLADLTGEECDYTGYTAGGIAVTAFNDPFVDDDGSGVLLLSPMVQFNTADVTTVGNIVGGAFYVDADGKLRYAVEFQTAKPMTGPGNSIPVVMGERFTT